MCSSELLLTLGAHAQRELRYFLLVCVCLRTRVCVCVFPGGVVVSTLGYHTGGCGFKSHQDKKVLYHFSPLRVL